VQSGYAFHSGVWYENDDNVSFTLSAQGGGNNRLDRVVLRKDAAANTVRLFVIEGTPGAVPALPALTANDMPLFYVWVADGFGAASTVDNLDIHDERIMHLPAPLTRPYGRENELYNSEFLSFSDTAGGTIGPEGWQFNRVAGSVVPAAVTTTDVQRGNGLDITIAGPSTEYVGQYLLLSPDRDNPSVSYYTLKGSVNITTGEMLLVAHDGTGVVASKVYRRTGETVDFVVRIPFDISSRLTAPYIRFYSNTANLDAILNPVMLVRGLSPGPHDRKHEIIKTDLEIADANWTDSAIAGGTHAIDLSGAFGPYIPRSVYAVLGRILARDDASAGGTASLEIRPHNGGGVGASVLLSTRTNDRKAEDFMIATISRDAAYGFSAVVTAAGNFHATIYLLGIAT